MAEALTGWEQHGLDYWHGQVLEDVAHLRAVRANRVQHDGTTVTNQLVYDLREVASRMLELAERIEFAQVEDQPPSSPYNFGSPPRPEAAWRTLLQPFFFLKKGLFYKQT